MPDGRIYENDDEGLDSGESPNNARTAATGCFYLVFLLGVTTCMLIINAIVCLSIHSALMSLGPAFLRDKTGPGPHLGQLFFFIVPVVLTIVQWNLLDRLNRLFRGGN